MNERELGELRRRLRPDRHTIDRIRGCYVNERREIISEFDQSLALMSESEAEKLLSLLRKCLSGGIGKNLSELTFSTQQVVGSAEHRRLMRLRDSALKDDEAIADFYQAAIQSLAIEGNYLILLAHDAYDVPYRGRDDLTQADASRRSARLFCAPCAGEADQARSGLRRARGGLPQPQRRLGPGRTGNGLPLPRLRRPQRQYLRRAVLRPQSGGKSEGLCRRSVPLHPALPPPPLRKTPFRAVLGSSLEAECSCAVVQNVRGQLCGIIEEHKANKIPEPLTLSKGAVREVLRSGGVSEAGSTLSPGNTTRSSAPTPPWSPATWWTPGRWRSQRRTSPSASARRVATWWKQSSSTASPASSSAPKVKLK